MGSVHSGAGEDVGWQLSSKDTTHSLGNWDGAAEIKNKIGDATKSDVTSSVADVMAILWIYVLLFSHLQQAQQIQAVFEFTAGPGCGCCCAPVCGNGFSPPDGGCNDTWWLWVACKYKILNLYKKIDKKKFMNFVA